MRSAREDSLRADQAAFIVARAAATMRSVVGKNRSSSAGANGTGDRGETHEGVIKARYDDEVPPHVEPITVSGESEVQVVGEFTSVLGYRPRRKVTEA